MPPQIPLNDSIDDRFIEFLHTGGTSVTGSIGEFSILLVLDVSSLLLQLERGIRVFILFEENPVRPKISRLHSLIMFHFIIINIGIGYYLNHKI